MWKRLKKTLVFLVVLLICAGLSPWNIGIPPIDAAGVWSFVDGGGSTGLNYDTVKDAVTPAQVSFNGELYAAWVETNGAANQIRVKKYNGFTWSSVDGGGAIGLNGDPAMNATSPVMAVYNNNLYIAWTESSFSTTGTTGIGRIHIKRYEGGNLWTFIDDGTYGLNYSETAAVGDPTLLVYNGELYAAWRETAVNGKDQIRVKKYNGTGWSSVDGAGTVGLNYNSEENAACPKLAKFGPALFAAWEETSNGISQIRVKRYIDGNGWTFSDGGSDAGLNWDPAKAAHHPQLVECNGNLYAAWEEQTYFDTTSNTYIDNIRLKKYDGTGWSFADGGGSAGLNKNPACPASNPALYGFGNKLYLTWNEEDLVNHIRQIRAGWYLTSWTFLDGGLSTGLNNDILAHGETPSMNINNGDLYISWNETYGGVNQIRVKKYPLQAVVTSVTLPANGTYGPGQALNFNVNFNKIVYVTGSSVYINVVLNTGGTVQAGYVSGSGTNTLSFRYTVQSGNLDTNGITVNGSIYCSDGTIGDSDNNADLTLYGIGNTAGILVDGVAPAITSVSVPASGAYGIGQNLDFIVNYSEAVTVDTSGGTPSISGIFDTGPGTNSKFFYAYYIGGSGTNALKFRYIIASGDQDTNGILAGSGALMKLNGSSIRDAGLNNALLVLMNVGSTTGILVDGIAPSVSIITLMTPAPFGAGKNLDFNLSFNENTFVDTTGGIPYFPLTMDTGTVNAYYVSGSGTRSLTFRYTIQTGDLDMNGISIGPSIIFNGGTIKDSTGNNAVLTLATWNGAGVKIDAVAPTVVSVTPPPNGSYRAISWLNFTVNFNEPVKVTLTGGIPYITITLNTGGTINASYTGGTGTSAITFRYYVQAGQVDPDGVTIGSSIALNGGLIQDNFNNNAVLALNNIGNTSGVIVDTVAPAVASVAVPANGIYQIGQILDFTVNFNEPVNVTTTSGTPFISLAFDNTPPNTPKAYYVSGSGTSSLVFRYTVISGDVDANGILFQGSTITLNGSTIKDIAGNDTVLTLNNVGNMSGILITAVIPRVVYIGFPANGTYIAGQNLDFPVYFSEPVTVDTTGGIPYVQITIGKIVNAIYISGSGSNPLIFRYTVQPGNIDTNGIDVGKEVIPNGAIFRDNINNVATIFTVTGYGNPSGVLVDGVAPTTYSMSIPGQGYYTAGQNLNFTVNFTEKVTVTTTGGTPYIPITLDVGGTANASYVSGSGTNALTFRYTVQAGNLDTDGITLGTSIIANGGTLKDTPGNDAVLTLNNIGNTSGVKVDSIAPAVASVAVPADGSYGAGQNLDLNVNFSEAVIVNFQYGTPYLPVTLDTGSSVNASYISGSGTNRLLFRYTVQAGNLDDTGIVLGASIIANAGAMKDLAGNNAALGLNNVGNTAGVLVDGIAPVIVSTVRTDNTHLLVTLSKDCINLAKDNDGGFTVTENSQRGITYPVTSIVQGADARQVVVTVTDMDISAKLGVIIKYMASGNSTIRDMAGNSLATSSTGFTIAAWSENRAPQFTTIPDQTTDENRLLQFTVTGTDLDRDPLTYSAANLPEGASFNSVTGEFSWTPGYDASGTYHIQFTVSDGQLTDTKDVAITVIDQGTLVKAKLLNSNNAGISGGEVLYAGSTWQSMGNTDTDGTVSIVLPPTTTWITVRMTYRGMSRELNQNIRLNPIFTFRTVNTTILFKDSTGNGLFGGVVTYAGSSWLNFGTTDAAGEASLELLPGNYKFRMTYAGASQDLTQDTNSDPNVVFQTKKVAVNLKDSASNGISGGKVTYAGSSWLNFGTTDTAGETSMELLPGSYTFRMTYAGASQDQTQNINTNPSLIFQTKNITVQLKDSTGRGLSGGVVVYAGSSWLSFGTTDGFGVITKELLPGNYQFRMTYAGGVQDQAQDTRQNETVTFQTRNTRVTLKDSNGSGISGGVVTYAGSSWLNFGTTDANGEAAKELLPGNYQFRMAYAGYSQNQTQNIALNPEIIYQTQKVTITLRDADGNGLPGGVIIYAGSSWLNFGITDIHGEASKELLPGSYTFRMTYVGTTQDQYQDIGSNPAINFQL